MLRSKNLRQILSIEDFDLYDQKLFLRLDLNVPIKNGKVTDSTRIERAIPTIRYALEQGAKVVIASHLGRPKADYQKELSLDPIAVKLSELMDIEVILIEEVRSEAPKALLASLKKNQLLMLENLRFDEDEISNEHGLPSFLASYIDIYINDAFGACHRNHASIVGLPQEVKSRGVGLLIEKEVEMLDHILFNFKSPYVAILGGAKMSDKIPMIEHFIDRVDSFVIGGAMAYAFLAAQDIPLGRSLVTSKEISLSRKLLERLKVREKNIYLPIDHRVSSSLKNTKDIQNTKGQSVLNNLMALDIGEKTEKLFSDVIKDAKTIFWNGPMGVFETPEFSQGTFAVAQAVAENTGFKVVGGGDSVAAVYASGFADKMTHISTGGGASLAYLQGEVLPGLKALEPIKQSDRPSDGAMT